MHASQLLVAFFAAATCALPQSTPIKRDPAADPDNLVSSIIGAAGLGFSHQNGNRWGNLWGPSQCDMTRATMPSDPQAASSTPLPAPNSKLAKVAIGRGTQNYTCDASQPSAAPTAVGALASFYDASCIASNLSPFLNFLPMLALSLPNPSQSSNDDFLGMELIGRHYFVNPTGPVINLNTANGNLGYVQLSKKGSVNAPAYAPSGQYGACPWLFLSKNPDVSYVKEQNTFSAMYRVNTAGGNPPKTCEGMKESFEVEYAAEYWIYE